MAKAGRKRKSGERFPSGKLKPLYDRGTARVQALRGRFARFEGGKADQQVGDPIGRAWAVGLLENLRVDPAALRDAGRHYASLYFGYYPTNSMVSNYTNETRRGRGASGTKGLILDDRQGEAFQRLDRMLKDAGVAAYDATQSLCLDRHWCPDDDPAWLGRLINARLLRGAMPVEGGLPTEADRKRLAEALAGLLALAEGRGRSCRSGGAR